VIVQKLRAVAREIINVRLELNPQEEIGDTGKAQEALSISTALESGENPWRFGRAGSF
jgi:hypothetical protein